MSLTLAEVTKVASLARLELTTAEMQQYQKQLSAILDAVNHLSELNLHQVPPTAHAVAQQNIWRDDEVIPSLPIDEVLFNAPEQTESQFLIQAVLDE